MRSLKLKRASKTKKRGEEMETETGRKICTRKRRVSTDIRLEMKSEVSEKGCRKAGREGSNPAAAAEMGAAGAGVKAVRSSFKQDMRAILRKQYCTTGSKPAEYNGFAA
jgi:hypothetical protein